MYTDTEQEEEQENSSPESAADQRVRPRLNPRLVFADPDLFFANFFPDLLMEQQEQS